MASTILSNPFLVAQRHAWQEEDDIDGSVSYARFRIDGIPERQARSVGNTLRRTLLRQELPAWSYLAPGI